MIRHTKQGMDAKKASKVLSFMMARKVPSYEGSYEGSGYGEIFELLLMMSSLTAGARPVHPLQRWRTAACHESGLHGPSDAPSEGILPACRQSKRRCISFDGLCFCLEKDVCKWFDEAPPGSSSSVRSNSMVTELIRKQEIGDE